MKDHDSDINLVAGCHLQSAVLSYLVCASASFKLTWKIMWGDRLEIRVLPQKRLTGSLITLLRDFYMKETPCTNTKLVSLT
jgi:hypothetical protein